MATLIRDDGIEFVIQPYRELLRFKNFNILKREVRYLTQSNGSFVRLFKEANGQYEAVFSHDPGFLLGETIWSHLGRPDNLILCEALDAEHVLLVIVRSGNVYLDAKIKKSTLQRELLAIKGSEYKYRVYVHGDVPLAEFADETHFALDDNAVRSFRVLSEGIYSQLEAKASLQLFTVEQALKEHSIGGSLLVTTVALMLVAIVAGGLIWKFEQHHQKRVALALVDPFASFKQALTTVDPRQQLNHLANDIITIYGMPGWVATGVNFADDEASMQIHSLGGNFAVLYEWAKANEANIQLSNEGAAVELITSSQKRKTPTVLEDSQRVAAQIIDNMMHIIPNKSVTIGRISKHGLYKEITMSIEVNNAAPNLLPLIGDSIAGMPVKLDNAKFQFNNGLISGSINLTILGS